MRRSPIALALILSVVASACGGGGAPAGTTEPRAPGVSAGPQQTPRSQPGYKDETPAPTPMGTPKSGYDY